MRQGEDKHHCIGEGERLRERGGGGNQLSTSPPPGREAQQRDRPGRRRHSLSHTQSQRRTDEHPGQCVEVRRELVWDSEWGREGGWVFPHWPAGPRARTPVLGGRRRRRRDRKSLSEKEGSAPQVLFLLTALPHLHHHGRMDHFGEAAGGGCPAALYYDWKVRH